MELELDFCGDSFQPPNEHRWGMNLLGLALQDVRDVLQAERDAKDSSGS